MGPDIFEKITMPIPANVNPNNIILPAPNLSVSHPSNGPNNAPPNLPKDATPETNALDHPNSSSIALNRVLAAWKVGPELIIMLNDPAIATHQP